MKSYSEKGRNATVGIDRKKFFSVWKISVPVAIGLAAVAYLFWHDAGKENFADVWDNIQFTWRTWTGIGLAILFMFGRDFGLSWRFRTLTGRQLRWGQAFKVDFLCEFTSCVTPSAVGGSSLGMVFLNTQGIEFGRATTLMMTTLLLDELFFVVFCPLVILLTPDNLIFASGGDSFSYGVRLTFLLVYAAIFVWTSILFIGIICRPDWMHLLLKRVFSWRILRRWREKGDELGRNMVAASKELKRKPFIFWVEVFGGTTLSWISRFLVVNALFFGFLPSADSEQWVILAREFVLWIVMMVSPTPGGAGLSEWLFSVYYADIVQSIGLALLLAVLWRIISYYLYLVIGVVIVPGWLKNSYEKFHK